MKGLRMRHTQGFTLIEMAIVIAIIGLIAGGIAGTRSFLRSSSLTTMMNEAKFYISAFNQFQVKYNAIPGDMADASGNWPTAFNGDGSGKILSSANTGAGALPEIFYSFQHLARAGFIEGSYTGATTGGAGTLFAKARVNIPAANIDRVTYLFDHPDYVNGSVPAGDVMYFESKTDGTGAGLYGHVLRIAAIADGASGLPALGFMSAQEALQLDAKYDDGIPNKGWVLGPADPLIFETCNGGGQNYKIQVTQSNACLFSLRIQ